MNRFFNIKIFFLLMVMLFYMCDVFAISIVSRILERYQGVYPEERVYFQVEVKYPESPTMADLRFNYIVEKNGNVAAESKVLKAFETQVSFMDFLILPQDSEVNLHDSRIEVRDYGDLSEEVSTSFKFSKKGFDRIAIYFFTIAGMLGILEILIMIDILRRRK